MGLMVPTPSQQLWQHNLPATISATVPGTLVTASASINTKGAYATLFAATTSEATGIVLAPVNNAVSAAVRNMLIDIAIGAAGSEVVIASNIMLNQTSQWGFSNPYLFFPIWIPKGVRVSARCQCSFASRTVALAAWLVGGGGDGFAWSAFQGVETIGADPATSKGFEHALGATNTFSAWTNIGSVSSRLFKAIQPVAQQGSDTTMTSQVCYLEVGVNSVTLMRYVVITNNVEASEGIIPPFPLYKRFPAGTQFMVRGTSQGAADDNIGIGLLGYF